MVHATLNLEQIQYNLDEKAGITGDTTTNTQGRIRNREKKPKSKTTAYDNSNKYYNRNPNYAKGQKFNQNSRDNNNFRDNKQQYHNYQDGNYRYKDQPRKNFQEDGGYNDGHQTNKDKKRGFVQINKNTKTSFNKFDRAEDQYFPKSSHPYGQQTFENNNMNIQNSENQEKGPEINEILSKLDLNAKIYIPKSRK